MANPEGFDAVLIHTYGYNAASRAKDVLPEPSARGRLVLAAGRALYQHGLADTFVISGRECLGRDVPVATVMMDHIRNQYDVANQLTLFSNVTAPVTTSRELQSLKHQSQKHNWQRVATLGWPLHQERIEILGEQLFPDDVDVTYLDAKPILDRYAPPIANEIYQDLFSIIERSEDEQRWRRYERLVLPIIKLPHGAAFLDAVANIYRPNAEV